VRALLVEDSRTCAEVATRVLRAMGYRVTWQGSALGARGAWADGRYDVLLIDVNIPQQQRDEGTTGNGLAFARHVLELQPGAKVIVWTSDGDPRVAAEVLAAGAAFLLKDEDLGKRLHQTLRAAAGSSA
jgi:CheY-like chemotaxis protein